MEHEETWWLLQMVLTIKESLIKVKMVTAPPAYEAEINEEYI